MFEKSAAETATPLLDVDEPSAAENDINASGVRKPSWLERLSPGSLTGRIALINLLGLAILTIGILYFNQFRQGLIDARVQSLMTQAQIISAAIAGSATADTGSIVINPEALEDAVESPVFENEALSGYEFPISPENAGPVLRRLLANTTIRARIVDRDGNLVVDSRFLYSGSDIIQNDLTPAPDQYGWIVNAANRVFDYFFAYDYPAYVDYGLNGNNDLPEVSAALNGASASVVRLNERREIIVLVSVPVQRYRAVLGSLILSTEGGEIDRVIHGERQIVLLTFGFSTLVSLLLSGLLAGTIARPLRKLSEAAEQVRRGISKRVEIPDFTQRKDEVGDLSGSLRDMTQALYKRIDAIEAFAADVSHELKNPLTSLRSAVETLERVKRDDQREKLIEVVKDDVKRMDRLITDISNASRLDAELARNETVSVDLAKMLNELVRVVNDSAKKGEALVELQIQTPAQLPAGAKSKLETYIIRCHEMRLGQVMHNLIDNARSFSADGSSVTIRLRRLKDSVDVRIEDQGPGIRPENLERIFERFYTDRPTDSFGKNSGLGLAISRQIIEAHKGRIWAENRLVKDASAEDGSRIVGARFVIRLPSGADEGEP
jgi:two-component system, OmpR family, sensor histidine kinase ChvG